MSLSFSCGAASCSQSTTCFLVRIPTHLRFIRKDGVEPQDSSWPAFRQLARSSLNGFTVEKPVRASMPGSDGDMRMPFHFSLAGSFAGRKRWRSQSRSRVRRRLPRWPAFPGRQDDERRALFVVPGQVVEILFLGENSSLRRLLAPGITPEHDRSVDLSRQFARRAAYALFGSRSRRCCAWLIGAAQAMRQDPQARRTRKVTS